MERKKCVRCAKYEEELDSLRGVEVVLRQKYADLDNLKLELKSVTERDERLKSELATANLALRKKAEELSRTVSSVHKLEEDASALRLENENLLTTLHEAFRANNSNMNNTKLKHKPKLKQPHFPKMQKLDGQMWASHIQDGENTMEIKDDFNECAEDDDRDFKNANINCYLKVDLDVGKEEEPDTKVCRWKVCDEQLCYTTARTAKELMDHVRFEHVDDLKCRKMRCQWKNCERHRATFKYKTELLSHIMSHTGYKPYRCKFANCGKAFRDKTTMKRHYNIHTRVNRYPCVFPGCGKIFARSDHMSCHVRLVHKLVKTTQCDEPSSSTSPLLQSDHATERWVHYKNDLICNFPDCKREFDCKSRLLRHTKGHYKMMPFCSPNEPLSSD